MSRYSQGGVAYFSCDNKVIGGLVNLTCNSTGAWDGQIPTCPGMHRTFKKKTTDPVISLIIHIEGEELRRRIQAPKMQYP